MNGCEVAIFLLSSATGSLVTPDNVHGLPLQTREYRGLLDRFRATRRLAQDLVAWNPDLVYHRFDLAYPAFVEIARLFPMVLEINTDDLQEYRLGATYRSCYNRLTRHRLLSQCRGIVYVTGELARLPHFACYEKSACVVGNGVYLEDLPPTVPPKNERPNIIFMGSSGQTWHGVDKILWLAQQISEWQFDLIGPVPAEVGNSFASNLKVHGTLNRSRYEAIVAAADVAIGTLALHRKGMHEASPLKVREYLAYGVPTIVGYQDTDFPKSAPFLLQLPNVPSNVEDHLPSILRFVEQWRGRRIARSDIAHLDVRVKEKARLTFFAEVLNDTRQRRPGAAHP